jgi:hypothetical protein
MLSRSHSRSSCSSGGDDDDEWDDDDDDDDLGTVRRYHLDFEQHFNRDNLPIPAEFRHESLPHRLWRLFLELRTSARQQRAARLLTMPSESFQYKLHTCLLTWCCDATDRGILTTCCSPTLKARSYRVRQYEEIETAGTFTQFDL